MFMKILIYIALWAACIVPAAAQDSIANAAETQDTSPKADTSLFMEAIVSIGDWAASIADDLLPHDTPPHLGAPRDSGLQAERDTFPKIGIVLSGGAARGFAHLGALQALEDWGIVPAYVSGASMGAIVGSIYASGMSPREIYRFARKQNYKRLLAPSRISASGGLIKANFINRMLDALVPHNSFELLQKKLYVSVTNIDLAQNEFISSGALKPAVCASAAIPLIFEPVVINGSAYLDGGLLNNLPVEPLLAMPDCLYIIGVSVVSTPSHSGRRWLGFAPMLRAFDIVVKNTEQVNRAKCHFFVEIDEAATMHPANFKGIDALYQMGYDAMTHYINATPALRRLGRAGAAMGGRRPSANTPSLPQ